MKNFFTPRSIAIIGASPTEGKVGNIILKNIINFGFKGKIYPINPNHEKIEGHKAYSSVLDIKEKVDLAVIAIPAKLVPGVIEECAWKHSPIKNITVISAGFSETGEEGKGLEKRIADLAKEYGLNILGPNCLGTVDTFSPLNASFAKTNVKKGKVSLIMQSGAFTTALFDLVGKENFGFSKVATLGNKMQLNETDFLDYFSKDKNTEAIVLYLESISDGRKFQEAIRKISSKKPVLVLKAGNSEKVKSAIKSHTGSMAGEATVIREAIEEAGGMYFENIRELFSAVKYFQGYKLPVSEKIAIVTNAGGPGVITTDLVEAAGEIKMMEFSEKDKKELAEVLPPASSVENPIDILGDAGNDRYKNALEVLSKNNQLGAVIALVTPQAQTDIAEIAEVVIEANKKSKAPVVPVVIGGEANELAAEAFKSSGMSNFIFPSDAVKALELAWQNGQLRKSFRKEGKNKTEVDEGRAGQAKETFKKILADNERKVFYYKEAKQLAELYAISAIDCREVGSGEGLPEELKFPTVAKIDSPKLLHKNSKNGLELGIKNQEEAKKALERLQGDFPGERVIFQPQVESGAEVILGLKKDPNFGTVLLCGLGGILTEIFNEKMIWFLPASKEEIRKKMEKSKTGELLEKQKINVEQVVEEAFKIAQMGKENERIKELDVNPMIFYKSRKPIAVDIKIIAE